MNKITINSDKFSDAIKRAVSFVSNKTTHDVLKNIKITVDNNSMTIISTDLEKSFNTKIDCENNERAEFLVDAKLISNIVSKLPLCNLIFELDTNKVTIKNDVSKSKFSLNIMPVTDFPEIPIIDDAENVFGINGLSFAGVLQTVCYAASKEQSRYFLNAVYVDNNAYVTTDGRRLAVYKREDELNNNIKWLIPIDFANLLPKLFSGEIVEAYQKDNHLFFKCGDNIYSTGLIDGNFPDYKKVLPTETKIELNINVQELKTKIERVMITVDEKTKRVLLKLSGNILTLHSLKETGESFDEIELNEEYENMTIGINGVYLLETLARIDSDNVKIQIVDSNMAIKFSGGDDCIHLIMPMKVE